MEAGPPGPEVWADGMEGTGRKTRERRVVGQHALLTAVEEKGRSPGGCVGAPVSLCKAACIHWLLLANTASLFLQLSAVPVHS